jgi:geranylgeranyl pyrophosphate synthase
VTVPATPDFAEERRVIDRVLATAVATFAPVLRPPVSTAIQYALDGEGKRLRAILVLAAYRAAGGAGDASVLASAVEVVHAYSLVHDDLPCMDNDELRRGRPTVHCAFDVATATAAGLAMVPLAAILAYRGAQQLGASSAERGEIVCQLMHASGASGMVGGQWMDLQGETTPRTLGALERTHALKTGELIAASVRIGAIAANAPARLVNAMDAYGRAVGLAFQITDDVLGITETAEQLGKPAGRDVDLGKSTYPSLLGVEGASDRARALVGEACAVLRGEGLLTAMLEAIARFTIERRS